MIADCGALDIFIFETLYTLLRAKVTARSLHLYR